MIEIEPSKTADTKTCDFANTSKEVLLASSRQHIGDIAKALAFFSGKIIEAAGVLAFFVCWLAFATGREHDKLKRRVEKLERSEEKRWQNVFEKDEQK